MDFGHRFLSTIKLRQLQYFLAIADTLHFTRAAELLAVTQPTLSHQIAELEANLGMPLFDRLGKSVRLTHAGGVFRSFAVRAVNELQAGRTALEELEGLARGTLAIGVIQSFSRTLLPPILGQFMHRHPAIRLRVEEMPAPEIERHLAAGKLDVGIAFAPASLEETELEPVLQERLILVVGRQHRLAARSKLRMAALDGEKLAMLSPDFTTRRLIDRYLEGVGVRPDVVCETNSMEVILGAVSDGPLAAILPEQAIGRFRRQTVKILQLTDPTPVRISALLWTKHSFRPIASRTFGEMVRGHFLEGRLRQDRRAESATVS